MLVKRVLISSVCSKSRARWKAVPYWKPPGKSALEGEGWMIWGRGGSELTNRHGASRATREYDLKKKKKKRKRKKENQLAALNRNWLYRAWQRNENMGPLYRIFPLEYFHWTLQIYTGLHPFYRRKTLLPHLDFRGALEYCRGVSRQTWSKMPEAVVFSSSLQKTRN